MIASFPSELPRPLRQGYQLNKGEGRLLSNGDVGPTKIRRRFSSSADRLPISFMLTRNELARFDRWYKEELKDGSLPFLMPDWGTDGWHLSTEDGALITDEAGHAIGIAATCVCQFGQELPACINIGVEWQVSFTLEILP